MSLRKPTLFQGAATALITPLKDGAVDYPALEKLINWQIDEGIDALVIAGTTGEGSTLTDEEHRELFEQVVYRFLSILMHGRFAVERHEFLYAIFACT